ncbi:MAG: hypothetical protein RIM72_02840 [Alphaproteobacteria bacterium]
MDIWDVFEYGAWLLSGILLLWMLIDTIRVNSEYDEDLLTSSREGIDELVEVHGVGLEGDNK